MQTDIEYSVRLLKKVNSLEIGGRRIDDYFMIDDYSLWSFQQFFIFTQIKEYSKNRDASVCVKRKNFFSKTAILMIGIVQLGVSLLAFIKTRLYHTPVLTFGSDSLKLGTRLNPRLFNIVSTLEDDGVEYSEIIHAYSGKEFFKNFFKRRRFVFYYDVVSHLFPYQRSVRIANEKIIENISLDMFSQGEKEFVKQLLDRVFENVWISQIKIRLIRFFLRYTKIKVFISVDDVRLVNEILYACKKEGVKTCIFQHSNFDYLFGLDALSPEKYIFPDIFFVWNAYWEKRISELSPLYTYYKNRIKIGGRPYKSPEISCVQRNKIQTNNTHVLIPYEVNVTEEQVRPYVQAMLASDAVSVSLLLRGDVGRDKQIEKYFGSYIIKNNRVHIVDPIKKDEYMAEADVVAGVYSGFLDEAIEACKPVAIFDTDYPIFNKMHETGIVQIVTLTGDTLETQLIMIKNTPHQLLEERKKNLCKGTGDARSVTRLVVRNINNPVVF